MFALFALSPAVVMAVGCLQMVREVAVYWLRLVLTRGVSRVCLICIDSFSCTGRWMFSNGKRGSLQFCLYLFLRFWCPLGVFK